MTTTSPTPAPQPAGEAAAHLPPDGRFCKKPVVIEAVHWNGKKIRGPVPDWLSEAIERGPIDNGVMRVSDTIHVFTLEGVMVCNPGDWLLCGIKGELYPCRADIFAATYEVAHAAR